MGNPAIAPLGFQSVPLMLLLAALQVGCASLSKDIVLGNLDSARMRVLRADGDINERSSLTDATPLMFAATRADPEFLRLLISKGAKVELRDSSGNTVAHYAAQGPTPAWSPSPYRLASLKLLSDAGVPVQASNLRGHTLLHAALVFAHADAIGLSQYLLERGVVADQASTKEGPVVGIGFSTLPAGTTPLMLAAKAGDREVAKLLLARNADPNRTDATGWTPLHYSVRRTDTSIASMLLDANAIPTRVAGSGRALQVTGQVFMLAGMRDASTGRKDSAVDLLRVATDAFDQAAPAFSSEATGQALTMAAANALSFVGAMKVASVSAKQMAVVSPSGKGFGIATYQTGDVQRPLRTGDAMVSMVLSEAQAAKVLLVCVETAETAEGVRACVR